jgi:hypothetical protein
MVSSVKKLNVYIIHASHLHERRRVIDELKKTLGKYTFSKMKVGEIITINANDPQEIPTEFIQKNIDYAHTKSDEEIYKIYNSLTRILHVNNVSNALKHHAALLSIAQCDDPDVIHLVIEDDVMYEPRMCMLLDKTIDLWNSGDYDMLFLGMPNNTEMPNTNVVKTKECKDVFRVLPYNDSYILSPKTARVLADNFLPLKYHTNIQLDYLCHKNNIKKHQTVPNIFVDGSKYGLFLSSLQVHNELVFNKDYMFVKNLINRDTGTQPITNEEKKVVEKIMTDSQIAENPDFMALAGKYVREIKKDHKKAYEIYQKTYDAYIKNKSILNNESMFLRDFINLHAHMQNDV